MDTTVQKAQRGLVRRAVVIFVCGFVWQILSGVVCASLGEEPAKLRTPLPNLVPVSTYKMQGAYSGFDVSLPVPKRWHVHEAVLTFSYVNSTALLRQNSRLTVELNQHPLAQIILDPLSPEGKVSVRLPTQLLKPGYNDLSFKVTQHYVLDCEDPTAPELWTTLKLDEAFLDWTISLKPVPLRLSALPELVFDAKIPLPENVRVLVESPSRDDTMRAVLAASAAALRFAYRPVEFSVSDRLMPGRDNILVGSEAFVRKVLGDKAPKIPGAYLEVRHMPSSPSSGLSSDDTTDPTHALIIVSGPDAPAVLKAVHTLAVLSFPFPDTAATIIKALQLPAVAPYQAPSMLQLDQTYSFKSLGFPTVTFQGYKPAPSVLRFRLPSDILIKPHKYATLSLHLAYSAGMREDSVLGLFLNGKFFSSIPLKDKNGGQYEAYRISFPTYLLRPGDNELAFHAVLTPLITGECTLIQTGHLLLTVFDDSTFHLPNISHWASLPDLTLFFKDGFPFAKLPDARETILFMPQTDFAAVEAAVNLLALMSQKIGYPPFGVQILDTWAGNASADVITVGALQAIPKELLEPAPYHLIDTIRASYPVQTPPHGEMPEGTGWLTRWMRQLRGTSKSPDTPPLVRFAQTEQTGGLSTQRAALMEYRLPGTSDRTLLVLTAHNTATAAKAAKALWAYDTQGACRGDMALISLDDDKPEVQSLRVGASYRVGSLTPLTKLDFFVYTYPWAFFMTVLVALAVLSFVIYRMLQRYRRRRLNVSNP